MNTDHAADLAKNLASSGWGYAIIHDGMLDMRTVESTQNRSVQRFFAASGHFVATIRTRSGF